MLFRSVTYTADAQKLTVNFIDDTTGKTLKTVAKTGYSDEATGYNTKADIQNFVGQHYDLVSDETKGADLVFDHNDAVDQVYDVHLIHHLTPISDHQAVNETIHYLGPDGNKLAPDKTQTITFTRHGVKDQVTDHVDWNPVESQEFKAVKSPVIDGYQADVKVVAGRKVLFGDQDVVINVHYTKLPEQKQEQGQTKQPGINLVNTYKVTPEKVVTVANGTVQKTKQNTVKNSTQSTTQDTKQLPQTGNDEQANLLSIIGGSLMTSLALFGLGKKKKHKN